MKPCDTCGNQYDKSFGVTMNGKEYVFDCFECAIHKLAPSCSKCGVRIIGHGVEANGSFYCGANCASQDGEAGLADRRG